MLVSRKYKSDRLIGLVRGVFMTSWISLFGGSFVGGDHQVYGLGLQNTGLVERESTMVAYLSAGELSGIQTAYSQEPSARQESWHIMNIDEYIEAAHQEEIYIACGEHVVHPDVVLVGTAMSMTMICAVQQVILKTIEGLPTKDLDQLDIAE